MSKTTPENSITLLESFISPEMKMLWQKAAHLKGCSLNDFVISTVQEAACSIIERHQILKLTTEESKALAEALLNPPQPNKSLKKAASNYKQIMEKYGIEN